MSVTDPEHPLVFVTKAWVAKHLGISEAEQERKRRAGTFPLLVVLSDDASDPQARVAYYYSEIIEWARCRPRRPVRLADRDDSLENECRLPLPKRAVTPVRGATPSS